METIFPFNMESNCDYEKKSFPKWLKYTNKI